MRERVAATASGVRGRLCAPVRRFSSSHGVGPAWMSRTRVMHGYRVSGVGDGGLGSSDSLHPIAVTRINPSAQLADGGGAVGLVEDAGADDEPVDAGAAGGG